MTSEPLVIEPQRRAPDTVRLRVDGDLDFDTAANLVDSADTWIAQGCRHVEIDLSGNTTCDSSGLSALVEVYHLARRADGTIRLLGANPRLRRLLERTGLDQIFSLTAVPRAVAADTGAGAAAVDPGHASGTAGRPAVGSGGQATG